MLKSSDIRQQFLDFFVKKHGHTFVPSSPVVPHDDPTLLFTNAGMNQFKPLFLGQEKRPYTRAVNTQKCIRAGGKHNDLDDVGRSRRHGTFFEMLGNWSFGDYFKRGAIEMAWELITKVWNLPAERLHVTCFEGDEKNGVPRDTEAADLWKEIAGLRDKQIHFFGAKDNFWEMGDTGPCGPCTEINIDRRPMDEIRAEAAAGRRAPVNGDDPRVMEFWNLVFIQYNRNPDRTLTPLPAQHVDTGMGFERICSILQDRDDMWGIDLFEPFWNELTKLSGFKYAGKYPPTNAPDPAAEAADPQLRTDIAFRVIADHIRSLTFAITDGAVPSNEGRGYVLRRILRRAVRFGRQQLELKEPFLHRMVDVVVDVMGGAFPELKAQSKHVVDLIHDEEVSFGRTLDRGLALFGNAESVAKSVYLQIAENPQQGFQAGLDEFRRAAARAVARLQIDPTAPDPTKAFLKAWAEQRPIIPPETAFKLHDTYGFPIDLTQVMAQERELDVDIAGYEKLMEEAREKARAGAKGGDSPVYTLPPASIAELQKKGVKPTDDSLKFGDPDESVSAKVMAIWNGTNLNPSADTSEDQEVAVILDRTNFYAEMGGQVGDRGQLASTNSNFDVETTRIVGGYVLHIGRVAIGKLSSGDPVKSVLADARRETMQNHTATHLANWALREVLGDAVQQKGSLVDPDKTRFDFSHNASLKEDEVARVEKLVGECIGKKMQVFAAEAPQQDAVKINGLRAVFGEKYPPMVRVVSIGVPVAELLKQPASENWRKHSIEFCGGTHLSNTSEIGQFVITSEESVSKGVRRIVALTGSAASAAVEESKRIDESIKAARALPESELPRVTTALQKQSGADNVPLTARRRAQGAVAELQDKFKKWEKSQKSSGAAMDVAAIATDLLAKADDRGGGKVVVAEISGASDDQLRSVIDSIKKRQPAFGALLAASDGAKVSFVAAVSDDLIAKGLKAGDWIREAAKATGGGGGGRPQMAQAGGKDPAKLPDALRVAREFAAANLK